MPAPTFSILLPTYNSEKIIGDTLRSIAGQTINDFEVIICDNHSRDNTEEVVFSFNDKRFKYFKNSQNLGYPGNLEKCRKKASGKYLYFMGSDDILSPKALELTLAAFKSDRDVGAVTRPYYWFEGDEINRAVRVVRPLNENKNEIVSIYDGRSQFYKVFESVGQLSALSMRKDLVEAPVNPAVFTAHIYPFLSVFKKHKIVFLKDYVLAVRIASSQTRTLSSIYDPSPTYTWVKMFQTLLAGKKYLWPRRWGVDHICLNFEGLVQIKNYAKTSLLYKEIWMLIKYRPLNLLNLKFWFFAVGTALIPRSMLILLVDYYKSKINANGLRDIYLLKG